MCSWGLERLILQLLLSVGAALTSGFLGVGACVACVASFSSRVIVRKLEREQNNAALVPTFSTNSRRNACYTGQRLRDGQIGVIGAFR